MILYTDIIPGNSDRNLERGVSAYKTLNRNHVFFFNISKML